VRAHAFANPFEAPGEQDLTAHVDVATLGLVATASGARLAGPVDQGAFLRALGIDQRAAALGERVTQDRDRLVEQMGELFKVIAVTHDQWPRPAGLA
jgi:NADH dehydrogenase [ubiquinone] 1 alpha subcomplex assembly factor 7